MAKKKASVKKSNVKKVAKKVAKKIVKKVAKKTAKKTPAKSVKKAPVKAKKAIKASAKKAAPKKAITKPKAKAPAKKATAKAPAVKAQAYKTPVFAAPKEAKIVDLSDFVTPLDDRLIVQTAGAEKMTAGGLYIPDTVADVSGNMHGHVVAVGRGHQNKKGHLHPMDVKLGDKVVFAQMSGTPINIKNQDLIILREGDVLGVVSK